MVRCSSFTLGPLTLQTTSLNVHTSLIQSDNRHKTKTQYDSVSNTDVFRPCISVGRSQHFDL